MSSLVLKVACVLSVIGLSIALHCTVGNPKAAFSDQCADGIACCKETVDGPSVSYSCAGSNDVCEAKKNKKKYKRNDEAGYEDSYVTVCGADNCNGGGAFTAAAISFLMPSLLAVLLK